MKKMNRSQSSYRQCKTLLNDEQDSWIAPNLQRPPKHSLANSYHDADKENNSLYQSISERNFPTKPSKELSDFEPTSEVVNKLMEKCKKQQQELSRLYAEKGDLTHNNSNTGLSKSYNYSQKYYQSQMQSLKLLLRQKDQELDHFKQEFSSRNEEMDSISSEYSSKVEKEQRDKNLYIKEINHKTIEITHLQERVKFQKSEIQTLKICLGDKDKTIREFQDKFGQVDMKKRKIQHYESQIKEREQNLKQLQNQTQRLKEQAEKKDYLIANKGRLIEDLEQTIGSYDDKLKSIEINLIKLKEEKKVREDKIQELVRECQNWRQSYEEVLKKNEQLQQIEVKLKTYQNLNEDLNKRNLELNSSNQKLKNSYANHEKHIQKYQELQKENNKLRQEVKDRDEKIIELQGKEKSHKHLEDCYAKVRKQKDENFFKLQERIKQNKALNLQLDDYRYKVANLEEELDEQEETSYRNKERAEKMDLLTKENHRLNDILQEKINQIQKLQIKVSNLETKISDKSNQIHKIKIQVSDKEQQINEMNIEISDLRQRYEIETNYRMAEADKVVKCNQDIYALKCSINKLETQKQKLQNQIDQITSDHRQKIQEFKAILVEVQNSKEQTEKLLQGCRNKVQSLNEEVDDCRKQLEEFGRKEKDHKGQMVRMENQLVVLNTEISALKRDKTKIIEKCQQLKEIHDFVMSFKEKEMNNASPQ